jgi:hypothetical protein
MYPVLYCIRDFKIRFLELCQWYFLFSFGVFIDICVITLHGTVPWTKREKNCEDMGGGRN